MDVQTGAPLKEAFFRHGLAREPSTGPMQDLTRYLCAAMYLDKDLCDTVTREYVHESDRAVVPSHGYDLEPVIRHARSALRLRLVRDIVITWLWLVLLVVSPLLVFLYLAVLGGLTMVARVTRRGAPRWGRVALAALLTFVYLTVTLMSRVGDWANGSAEAPVTLRGDIAIALVITCMVIFGLFSSIVIGHLALVLRRLTRALGPGAYAPGTGGERGRFGAALGRIRAAQYGNITLYAGDNPFLGTGHPRSPNAKVWSVVLELDRRATGPLGTPTPLDGDALPAAVDPVVMHERIRAKLHEMRDDRPSGGDGERPLPPNERVDGLVTGWHLTARGRCVQRPRPVDDFSDADYSGHPLIDPSWSVPYSMASEEAIEAVVRHPRGGLRCFQRVSVGFKGQSIRTPDGDVVAPAEEHGAMMSAFVHIAVEGRMLYGQFAATVLPPVRPVFRIVDEMPAWRSGTLLWKAFVLGLPGVFTAPVLGPFRLVAELRRIVRQRFAAGLAPVTQLVHDYGARICVRELVADDDHHDFVEELDADKYTRLIERRVNEALLDYLGDECGIDVSAYRAQTGVIMNEGVIMTGGTVHGQVAVGRDVHQRQGGGDRINP